MDDWGYPHDSGNPQVAIPSRKTQFHPIVMQCAKWPWGNHVTTWTGDLRPKDQFDPLGVRCWGGFNPQKSRKNRSKMEMCLPSA